jgi:hypothetical protein
MVRGDAVVVAMPTREGFSDEVANEKERRQKIPVLADDQTVHPEPRSPYVLRISSAGPIALGVFPFFIKSRYRTACSVVSLDLVLSYFHSSSKIIFIESKKTAFQNTIPGHLFRTKNLEIKT